MDFLDRNRQLIRILEAIQAFRSISKAAEALFITQPTLSKIIRKTENQYQISLIDRTQHPFTLTPAGTYYLKKTKQLVQDYQIMRNQLARLADTTSETLTIGVNASLAQLVLPPVLTDYHQQFADVHIQLIEKPARQLEADLLAEKLDVYIGIAPAFNPELKQNRLYTDSAVLIIPPTKAQNLPNQPVSDISAFINDQDFIMETETSSFQRLVASYLAKYDCRPKVVVRTANITTAFQLAIGGLGATIVPKSLLLSQPRAVSYGKIQIKPVALPLDVTVSQNRNVPQSPASRHFIATLQRRFSPTH